MLIFLPTRGEMRLPLPQVREQDKDIRVVYQVLLARYRSEGDDQNVDHKIRPAHVIGSLLAAHISAAVSITTTPVLVDDVIDSDGLNSRLMPEFT